MNAANSIKSILPAEPNRAFFDDKPVKLVAIPLLGIIIPNISGIITHSKYSFWQIIFSYTFFIFISLVVWQGNVMLMGIIRKQFRPGNIHYYKTILAIFFSNIIYTGIVSSLLLLLWAFFSKENYTTWNPVIYTSLIIIIVATFITNIYENFLLNSERVNTQSRVEQLSLAKAQAELHALRNQIDPHFIFNSLNTLSYLITNNQKTAKLYNDTLARVYHYILRNKEKNLVLLREELEFISNYFYLLKIRFDNSINMEIEINNPDAEENLILPISLQALVENAIKHNEFTESKPLNIHVSVSPDYVVVKNIINKKTFPMPSSGTGLNNLDNRYRLVTDRNIQVHNNQKSFIVRLPILNLSSQVL